MQEATVLKTLRRRRTTVGVAAAKETSIDAAVAAAVVHQGLPQGHNTCNVAPHTKRKPQTDANLLSRW